MRGCAATLAAAALLVPAREAARTTEHRIPNMNGEYVVANSDAFPTNYMSYPGGVESFDAYHGPITSTYSQVWWTSSTDPLPREIIERFDGKVMAIVGVEMDQVRKGAGPDGQDMSVPINVACKSAPQRSNQRVPQRRLRRAQITTTTARSSRGGRPRWRESTRAIRAWRRPGVISWGWA